MKIYIGTDHHGFKLKEKIKGWLIHWGYKFEDLGAVKFDPHDDYTIYAEKVASVVGKGKNLRGILLCKSGVGMDITANKFDGVRASIGKAAKQVKAGRRDDDMNILVIAADYTSEDEAKEMARAFLETEFDEKKRHKRRLEEIKRIEENN
ncbi:hypothetical protein A2686_05310 [Candidatus Woesebacteria bacterium RIFCSPHIGHO2_01_FULL_38_10]|uniref:Ribose-5-phosphate isomerase n=1 Tax=Candidatus Woesebacteria bacterium RIFCSPLOWO2_01_FULL_39_10b TaxID=1802517 RepID=A0A1F8B775_9BACT|nr:MAG: hypothetical protein A2686_05310 [Candidatus Woesebacteria bacterium RIFCSPHIGHO2_01_FULL_38_10]OGM59894.1 MAG: hypothetical protein A2892_02830 [Candidatus Woesebacteria bacterium RIFCSPLOWO2_01_FULL_39_10b]